MNRGVTKLENICNVRKGTNITRQGVTKGEFPVVAGGMKPSCYHNAFNRNKNCITVSGSGYAGYVNFWSVPIFASDCITVEPIDETQDVRFVFHYLKSIQQTVIEKMKSGTAQPHVYKDDIAKIDIPVVPIDEQRRISNVLDNLFKLRTELELKLEEELKNRLQQFHYYLNSLFTTQLESEVQFVTLGEVGEFIRGNGLLKNELTDSGVGCIHYGQIYTHYDVHTDQTKSFVSERRAKSLKRAKKGNLIIATTGETDEDLCKAVTWLGEEEIAISSDAHIYQHSMNPKFVAYFFRTDQFHKQKRPYITGTKVRRVDSDSMGKIKIPICSAKKQRQTVKILDKLNTIVNELSEYIPAEIEFRRKQFEHYRNQVLTFGEEK